MTAGVVAGGCAGGLGASGASGARWDAAAAESASTPAADHYQVVIHVDDTALRGGIGRSELPIDTVKRLTCDGSIVTIVEDERGTPLDVGRKQRTVSTPLKRALWSRDRHCTFPGCRNRRYIDAHHVRHWAEGGATTVGNLTLLCSYHHRLVHEGGFAMRRDGNDENYFVRPDGRVIPRCGYRIEDMLDGFVESSESSSTEADLAARSENLSAEGYSATSSRDPSAEGRPASAAMRDPSGDGWPASAAIGDTSADGWLPAPARDPSAEVREAAGVYRIGRRRLAA